MGFESLYPEAENALTVIIERHVNHPELSTLPELCLACPDYREGITCPASKLNSNPGGCFDLERHAKYLIDSGYITYSGGALTIESKGWAYSHLREKARLEDEQQKAEHKAERKADHKLSWIQFGLNALFMFIGLVLGAFLATNTKALDWLTKLF